MKVWQLVFLHYLNNFQTPYRLTRGFPLLISDIFHCTTAEYSVISPTTELITQFPFRVTFPLLRLDCQEPYPQLNRTLTRFSRPLWRGLRNSFAKKIVDSAPPLGVASAK